MGLAHAAQRRCDGACPAPCSGRGVFVWLLMGLALLSMPFTGWWMVHLVGWPLGQTWLLALECALYRGGVGVVLVAGAA